jgi:hypothetical protein
LIRTGESGLPCGVAFRYGEVTMSGGALGRGYTWKKLQERGLTYDGRDIEAIERARAGARPRRQQIADRERTVSRAPRTVSHARGGAVNDRPIGGAIREAVAERDGQEVKSQQHTAWRSAPRGDQASGQSGLSEAEANITRREQGQPIRCESVVDESPIGGFTTPYGITETFNFDPHIPEYATPVFIHGARGVEQPATAARESRRAGLGGERRVNNATHIDNDDLARTAGVNIFGDLSPSDASDLTIGFRDGIREAIRETDEYMQDYWLEDAQYQASTALDLTESVEADVEAEMEVETIIADLLIL